LPLLLNWLLLVRLQNTPNTRLSFLFLDN
jgi:hypothetical protein